MDEGKGIALVILGIVAVVAIIGLVLMFSGGKGSGAAVSAPGFVKDPYDYANLGKYYVVPGEAQSNAEAWQSLYYRDVAGQYAAQPGDARANQEKSLGDAQDRAVTQAKGMYARQ